MASHQPPSPPPPASTTINDLTDDLLREVFLRLPDIPSLVRAASTCPPFLRAIRSSPAFPRRFRELHAPPLLALFCVPYMSAIVPASSRTSEQDIAAAFSDLLRDDDSSEWGTESEIPYSDGYICFVNRSTEQGASYNPLNIGAPTQALNIYPKKPAHDGMDTYLEFHTLPPDEEQRPSRVVCVHHERAWAWARVAVFCSHSMEWQVFPESGTLLLLEGEGDRYADGRVVNGFVCWVQERAGCILALNTTTFQFSRMDLPQPLRGPHSRFEIGQTKDGKLCIVHEHLHEDMFSVWLWTVDDEGVDRFVLHKKFSLHTMLNRVTELSVEADNVHVRELMTVIDGFLYLSVVSGSHSHRDLQPSEWFLSFCLETEEVALHFKKTSRFSCHVDPYIMSWPPSLMCIKEDSETQVTGDSAGDDGCVGTKEGTPVLFTALRSFKEALIDDDNTKFAEMDAFLLDDEINSLQDEITVLEVGLAAGRDSVLRMGAHTDISKEAMERESWWQVCKGMLWRARSRFFAS